MCPCNAELRLVPQINSAFGEVFNILIGKCASGVNVINVKNINFLYECHFGSFYYIHVTRKKLPKQRLYEKFARLTLMKLTAGLKIAT